jgi:hypothetical protein
MTATVLTSASAQRLERELCARVLALLREEGARLALVVPTARLADRVRRALVLASDGGVVAGVEVLHHRALAEACLERAFLLGLCDAPPPRVVSELERDALVRAALAQLPEDASLRRLAARRPRIVASLAATLSELREAHVDATSLAAAVERHDEMPRLLAALDASLDQLMREQRATDAAGHALAAAQAARALAGRRALPWSHLVHHGSYALVGTQAALVGALELPTLVFAPCGRGPAHEAARSGLRAWPGPSAVYVDLDPAEARAGLLDTEALFDESGRRAVLVPEAPVVEAWHVRGARAEVDLAARLAARAHVEGKVPLDEIAVLSRSLEPHAAHLEAGFGAHGVPFTTSAEVPLLREPWAQAFALLLRALTDDLPRATVSELLRSPWIRIGDDVDPAHCWPDSWDEWTRAAGIVGGVASYGEGLLAWHRADVARQAQRRDADVRALLEEPWAREREASLRALAVVVARLARDAAELTRPRTHAAHAELLRDLAGRWLRAPGNGAEQGAASARDAITGILGDLARLDAIDGGAVTSREIRSLVDEALARATLPMGRRDGAGVQVLAAMPARALPSRVVILMGLDQGIFPRRARQDPFLRDDTRIRLRATHQALEVKSEGALEERQILASVLGSASERFVVTWQRADDDGRARAASLYLREIARLALGEPDLDALLRREKHPDRDALDARLPLVALPGHPAEAARDLRTRLHRATWRDAAVEASQRTQRRRAITELARLTGRGGKPLEDALAALAQVDAFRLDDDEGGRREQLSRDLVLGPGIVATPHSWAATSLERLGTCAQLWLFERGWHVPSLEDEPEESGAEAREMGTRVHGVLESVYDDVIERGGWASAIAAPRTRELLVAAWDAAVRDLAGERWDRAPLAWEMTGARWREALLRFLVHDATRLAAERARVHAVELPLRAELRVREGEHPLVMRLAGRVDRLLALPDGWRVEDYKTGGDVGEHAKPLGVLKGRRLQGLIYRLLVEGWLADQPGSQRARVDVAFVRMGPDLEEPDVQALDLAPENEAGWRETLRVLAETFERGAFPLRKGEACSWCSFTAACRRHHVPTRERLSGLAALADYRDIERKSTRARLLSDVRGGGGEP